MGCCKARLAQVSGRSLILFLLSKLYIEYVDPIFTQVEAGEPIVEETEDEVEARAVQERGNSRPSRGQGGVRGRGVRGRGRGRGRGQDRQPGGVALLSSSSFSLWLSCFLAIIPCWASLNVLVNLYSEELQLILEFPLRISR